MSERAAWFERKPRSSGEAQPKGTRELLPVKAGPNDSWKRQHVKVKGKRKREASKAEAAPPTQAPAPARSLEEEVLDTVEKKQRIAKLATQLLQAPHKSIGLLEKLHEYATRDGSAVVRKLALLSEVAALRDLIPAYRIRPPTAKELAMKVCSKGSPSLRWISLPQSTCGSLRSGARISEGGLFRFAPACGRLPPQPCLSTCASAAPLCRSRQRWRRCASLWLGCARVGPLPNAVGQAEMKPPCAWPWPQACHSRGIAGGTSTPHQLVHP